MKPGDIVTIFTNPLAETCKEGQAKLIKKVSKDKFEFYWNERRVQMWMVQFPDGEAAVCRKILSLD
jgi:hypothetical protein